MIVKSLNDNERPLVNCLNLLLTLRHNPIIPWQGGFVCPREEVRKVIRDLRRWRSYES